MNANDYQKWTQTTAQYPHAGLGDITALAYVILALGGEVGEIQNKFKKVLRGDPGATQGEYLSADKEKQIFEEFVGVMYYIGRLADELGVSMEGVMDHSRGILEDRQERGVIKGDGDDR